MLPVQDWSRHRPSMNWKHLPSSCDSFRGCLKYALLLVNFSTMLIRVHIPLDKSSLYDQLHTGALP